MKFNRRASFHRGFAELSCKRQPRAFSSGKGGFKLRSWITIELTNLDCAFPLAKYFSFSSKNGALDLHSLPAEKKRVNFWEFRGENPSWGIIEKCNNKNKGKDNVSSCENALGLFHAIKDHPNSDGLAKLPPGPLGPSPLSANSIHTDCSRHYTPSFNRTGAQGRSNRNPPRMCRKI